MSVKPLLHTLLVKPAGPDCNLGCTYCYYLDKQKLFSQAAPHRMSDEMLENLIRQAMQQSGDVIFFAWQGGEPSLMGLPFYERVIEFQKRYGQGKVVGNALQTNGTLLDVSWALFLKKHSWLVGLSLDGPEPIHNRYRLNRNGEGSHQRVEETARMLLGEGVATNVLCCVTDYSSQFPDELYDYYKDLGLIWMQFIPVVEPDPRDGSKAAPYSLEADAYGHFLIRLFDLWIADFRSGQPITSIRFFESLFYRYVGMDSPECTFQKTCGSYLVVEHNGDCFPCDFFVEPRWKLGSIREQNLIDMFHSSKQKAFGQSKVLLPPKCSRCAWRKKCYGACIKDRIKDPSDLLHPRFCRSYQMLFTHADPTFRYLAEEWSQQQKILQKYGHSGKLYDATKDFRSRFPDA
ncbi:MAG TPA: anaerobic sulfatase maturase [Prolixibacteraceae bacterium]|nr:anaerobic sulfatase maturase [Prolixibacteraceae bacterium]